MRKVFCIESFRKVQRDSRVFSNWDEANKERKRLQRMSPENFYMIEEVKA